MVVHVRVIDTETQWNDFKESRTIRGSMGVIQLGADVKDQLIDARGEFIGWDDVLIGPTV